MSEHILKAVRDKLIVQLGNTKAAQKQAVDSLQQVDPDCYDAAQVLIRKFGNPQGTVQIIQAVYQAETLGEVIAELEAMVGAATAAIPDENEPAAT